QLYTLSLHDALPISVGFRKHVGARLNEPRRRIIAHQVSRELGGDESPGRGRAGDDVEHVFSVLHATPSDKRVTQNHLLARVVQLDRKSTRLNSSHVS